MEIFVYQIGSDVKCRGRGCGQLSAVVVDPDEGQVSDLIVEEGLPLLKKAWVIPQSAVQKADDDDVWLDLSQEELRAAQPYERRVIREVAPGYEETPANTTPTGLGAQGANAPKVRRVIHEGLSSPALVVLKSGVDIVDPLEQVKVGELQKVVVEAKTGKVSRLIVNTGLLSDDLTLPASAVRGYDEDRILVQTDEPPTREPEEQVETLSVKAPVDSDLPLPTRVEIALREDARTTNEVIEVIEQQGVVTLVGEVQNRETSEAAAEIVAEQKGVTFVHNNLRTRA